MDSKFTYKNRLKTLLEFTKSINENYNEEELFFIYKGVVQSIEGVEAFTLFSIASANKKTFSGFENKEFEHSFVIEFAGQPDALFSYRASKISDEDIDFIKTLTSILIQAVENKKLTLQTIEQEAIKRDLEMATKVQNMLFPKKLPYTDSFEMAASYIPYKTVSGDYYDYIEKEDGHYVISIADVSGKGVSAALLMSNFQAALRVLVRQNLELSEIVTELNDIIFMNSQGERFITCFIAEFCPNTNELHYINAGHNPPFYVTKNHEITFLKEGTTMLGIIEKLPLLSKGILSIQDYSLLFMYTDGLVEVFNKNGIQFTEEQLVEFIKNEKTSSLQDMHNELLNYIENFTSGGGFNDDITILSCKFQH